MALVPRRLNLSLYAMQVEGRLTEKNSFLHVVPDWKGPTQNALYVSLLTPTGLDKYMDKSSLGHLVVQSKQGKGKSLQIFKTKQLALIAPGMLLLLFLLLPLLLLATQSAACLCCNCSRFQPLPPCWIFCCCCLLSGCYRSWCCFTTNAQDARAASRLHYQQLPSCPALTHFSACRASRAQQLGCLSK
jgi:hypothetical protein